MSTRIHPVTQAKRRMHVIKHAITSVSVLAVLLGSIALATPPKPDTTVHIAESVQQAVVSVLRPLAALADQ